MSGIREFLGTSAGKYAAIGVTSVLALVAVWSIWSAVGADDAMLASNERMYIDAETGQPFAHTLQAGDRIPILAPSGKDTGYPAELCYWTADGKAKTDPTVVLLNQYKGESGPTFCPDCGRLVVQLNPPPAPGESPPPLKSELKPGGRSRRPRRRVDTGLTQG